jgi:hypothetical protein
MRGGAICAGLLTLTLCGSAQETEVRREQFQAEVQQLQEVVAGCKAAATACDGKSVGTLDERVGAAGSEPEFAMRWGWLRDALTAAGKAKDADRQVSMSEAAGRLEEIAAESASAPEADAGFAKARAEASRVLAQKEFEGAAPSSWLERQWYRFWAKVGAMFDGVDRLGESAPWLGRLLEVLFYLAAAVGLVMFVRRSLVRQRLAIALGAGAGKASAWERESKDWAKLAEACAAEQEWREAVHCLYWAAIVKLEARRAWRHNPARTPREYVRLLKPGSAQQGALRGLTQIFERVWYGLREADREDYARARGLFEGLGATPLGETQAAGVAPEGA